MNNNVKIVVDAGHGGSDPGTSGNGLVEKEYTLKFADYLNRRFNELGANSTLVRSTDETVTPTERVNRILNAYGNSPDVLVISNHLNAGGSSGAEVIYALRNNDNIKIFHMVKVFHLLLILCKEGILYGILLKNLILM